MPLTNTPLPFGLRRVNIYPLAGEVAGAAVRLPNSRTFSFSETEDYEELRGDDATIATHGMGPSVDWELEGGGTPLEAIAAMFGGTITESGVAPNTVKTYSKGRDDERPYFQVMGRAISDSGGDFHLLIYRCKATGELSGELADGSFWLTGASGRGLARESDGALYDFIQNETAVELPATGTP